ncbi:MAG: response regulator [Mogibacterium sp.]|nr:response regulator [Mogibacterium sp.]
MITLAVDDILSTAQQIRDLMKEIDPEGCHYAESDPGEVHRLAIEKRPDLIWLDIEMPGINGLELAAEIKTNLPDTNIVFVTGYSNYAVDAFGMHVSGYVLKPVTKERLLDEIENLRIPLKEKPDDEKLLRVQCFGNFEVFGRDGIVKFGRSLSKEAFAYLIDRRGAGCTVAEICSILWEDRTADKSLKSQCRVVMGALKKDLEKIGAEAVIVKNWNTWGIDTSKVDCDYYNFLKGDSGAVNLFRGEYMSQYSWAEMTVGRLFDITE